MSMIAIVCAHLTAKDLKVQCFASAKRGIS